MKRGVILILFFCLSLALYQGNAEAVWGIPDNVQSATLVVPFMEKGISSVHDTLTVVDNLCAGNKIIHWQVWDIDGNATPLYGNVNFGGSWVSSFSTILSGAAPETLTQLTDGSFYRGFMTIDMVTAATNFPPTTIGEYPFSGENCLTGWTYYVRLLEGAANGIPMIHIEGGLGPSVNPNLKGFYQDGDDREEIDNNSRYAARLLAQGQTITTSGADPNAKTDYVVSRVYCQGNGESRIVLWTWASSFWESTTAKPSEHTSGGPFYYIQFNELGVGVVETTVTLNHIVNVINVPGDTNGQVWIANIPNNFEVYAFSFNAANYSGNAALTWEAMFESTIIEQLP